MATKKKTSAPKTTAKKTAAKKKPVKKAAPKKAAKKTTTLGSIDHKIASNALKLVDQASILLRKGIRTGANTSEKARHEAKQKAHALLNKASSSLGDLLSGSTSVLRRVINKLE